MGDLEKPAGADHDMALDLEISQGVKKRFEPKP